MPKFDVIGIGTAACDYLVTVDHFPGPDQKVRAAELTIDGGGTVGTALAAVARLGLRAAWLGALGEDEFGRVILETLERDGVDTSLVRLHAGARSPFSFCVATPPHRNVFSVRPTTPPLDLQGAEMDAALDTRFVHLDGSDEALALEVAAEARRRGVGVSLDLQRGQPFSDRLLDRAEIAVVSESFARERYGSAPPEEALRALYRPDMRLAAITLGAHGVIATDGSGTVRRIAADAVETVDTTGAGDVFHGALLVAVLDGHSLDDALRFATRAAALSCRALGGRAGIPSRDELADWA